jgi:hypothetical protein
MIHLGYFLVTNIPRFFCAHLDASTAASVERLVLDALELVDQREKSTASVWPDGFWSQIRDDFGTEGIERPPQGEFEKREIW